MRAVGRRPRLTPLALIAVVMLGLVLTGFEHLPKNAPAPPRASGFVVLYDAASLNVFLAHAGQLSGVYLDTALLTPSGQIQETASSSVLNELTGQPAPVELTVSNLASSRTRTDVALVDAVLNHPARVRRLVGALRAACAAGPFSGINIDFEAVPKRERGPLLGFLGELGRALHDEHKTLSIDVPALTFKDAAKSAFSYRAIGRRVDAVLIMAYDYSYPASRPGPIAPLWWVKRVVAYARTEVPTQKIRLGLPFYGYDWSGHDASGLTLGQVAALIDQRHPRILWNRGAEAPYFHYRTGAHTLHTVYFTDTRSLLAELRVARSNDIAGVFYWFVGSGTPAVWQTLDRYQPNFQPAPR